MLINLRKKTDLTFALIYHTGSTVKDLDDGICNVIKPIQQIPILVHTQINIRWNNSI